MLVRKRRKKKRAKGVGGTALARGCWDGSGPNKEIKLTLAKMHGGIGSPIPTTHIQAQVPTVPTSGVRPRVVPPGTQALAVVVSAP